MKSAWIGYSLVVGSLLLAAPAEVAAREPKSPNPCRELKKLSMIESTACTDARMTNLASAGKPRARTQMFVAI